MDKSFDYFRIGRARISITSYPKAISTIKAAIKNKQSGYVCVSNMRTVNFANTIDAYQEVMEKSLLNTPDGTPLMWCGRWWGLKEAERVCGPHLFNDLLNDKDPVLSHFFLGDTEETLTSLKSKIANNCGAKIAGSFSPPFKPLEDYDLKGIAKMINDSGATVVWTSLRAPKQDYLGAMLLPYLNNGVVLIGVGAAFRFYLGEYKEPDGFLAKIGLGGLYVLRKGTTFWKEFSWYVKHTLLLIKYFFIIKWRKLRGKKYYEI